MSEKLAEMITSVGVPSKRASAGDKAESYPEGGKRGREVIILI
jgi:hypothetical protein